MSNEQSGPTGNFVGPAPSSPNSLAFRFRSRTLHSSEPDLALPTWASTAEGGVT